MVQEDFVTVHKGSLVISIYYAIGHMKFRWKLRHQNDRITKRGKKKGKKENSLLKTIWWIKRNLLLSGSETSLSNCKTKITRNSETAMLSGGGEGDCWLIQKTFSLKYECLGSLIVNYAPYCDFMKNVWSKRDFPFCCPLTYLFKVSF